MRRHLLSAGLVLASAACSIVTDDRESSEDAIKAQCITEETIAKQSFDSAVAAWLKNAATDLRDDAAMLDRMEKIVGKAKIVGFGEPDHGFHEFAELRNKVFKMLVERKDFRAITLETGIIEARVVDRYVTDVEGTTGITLDEVLKTGFTHDMGEWEETAELVTWVRQHNEQAARAGKPLVHWGGKDLTVRGDTLTVALDQLSPIFERLGQRAKLARLAELAQKASAVTAFVERILKEKVNVDHIDPDHLDAVCSLSYDQLSDAERVELASELRKLADDLVSNREAYVAQLGADELEWTRLMVEVGMQIQEDLEHRARLGVAYGPTNSAGSTLEFLQKVYAAAGEPLPAMRTVKFLPAERNPYAYTPEELTLYGRGREIRERHLAANVGYLEKTYGKTFNFAASSHVQRVPCRADAGNAAAEGQFIAAAYGKSYVVIGGTASTFDTPAIQAEVGTPEEIAAIRRRNEFAQMVKQLRADQEARTGSFERRFDQNPLSGLVVDFRDDPTCSRPRWVNDWLRTEQLTWVGLMKYNMIPRENYDALFWVRHATFGHRRGS
jgi:erythromycin esterase-like protein